MTPHTLAAELGYSDKTIRAWLRTYRPRDPAAKWSRWELSREDEDAVRRRFATRVGEVARGTVRWPACPPPPTLNDEWSWEGNVQAALVRYLRSEGWTIEHTADTARKEPGDDVRARKDGRVLRVEVKGWPTKGRYADPRRAGEVKRAPPSTQAGHWYSQALLHVMRDLGGHPTDEVAIALPDAPRFRSLIAATERALCRLGVGVYFVREGSRVEARLPHLPGKWQ